MRRDGSTIRTRALIPTLLRARRRHATCGRLDAKWPSFARGNERATRVKERRASTNQPVAFPETGVPTTSGKAGKLISRGASCIKVADR